MKIISFFLIAFAFNLAGWAQAPAPVPPGQTPGFLDVPWGSNAEFVKKEFPARSRARFDRTAGSDQTLEFTGGKFAGFKVSRFFLHLKADRFWKADVNFEAVTKDHLKEFETLKQLLIEKYGPPSSDNKTTLEWYLKGPPGVDQDKIVLSSDSRGSGMKMFYAADRIQKEANIANPPDPGSKNKPISVAPKAKDDL